MFAGFEPWAPGSRVMQHDELLLEPLSPAPPLLQHQQASTFTAQSRDASPPLYLSGIPGLCSGYGDQVSETYSEACDEPPVYRSISTLLSCDSLQPDQACVHDGDGGCGMPLVGCPESMYGAEPCLPPAEFHFEFPRELFEIVLSGLSSHPDLFNAMAVSCYWKEEARALYARRTVRVPPLQGELLQATIAATPGDTLLLDPGMHWLASELLIEKPLRLGVSAVGSPSVVATHCPSLLRTRATVMLKGLTLCRMGDAEGHPNAVIVAESGVLSVELCRVTCGGTASTLEEALRVFDSAPEPGGNWQEPPLDLASLGDDGVTRRVTRQGPQSGVWVGTCAQVTLRHNTIACCSGPGVKIYRGRLLAEHNTIAFSRCGANVVSNSGRVVLTQNAIHGARGDGVSSWNNSHVSLENNAIYSNRGTGITINTGGGSVSIVRNSFFDNMLTAIQFATSNVKKVTIGAGEEVNDWTRNEAGGLSGLSQHRPSLSEPFDSEPLAPPGLERFTPPALERFAPPSLARCEPTFGAPSALPMLPSITANVEPMEVDARIPATSNAVTASTESNMSMRSGWSVEM